MDKGQLTELLSARTYARDTAKEAYTAYIDSSAVNVAAYNAYTEAAEAAEAADAIYKAAVYASYDSARATYEAASIALEKL